MKRKHWKTMLYIIITIILSVYLYFNIVESIHDHRFIKLATEAAEEAIESKDFSLYNGLEIIFSKVIKKGGQSIPNCPHFSCSFFLRSYTSKIVMDYV
nr:hypothetical protein [uncultured Clostridium sp.]